MFSPGSSEKNSSTLAESHSPGRSKFPVGLNQFGDEGQQNNRIQSAVHRYNNSTVGSLARTINERNIPSPFRHAFLKNGQKYKNFESDKEELQNNLKKSHNHYQGIGNFPVVHLTKSSIITRSVKKHVNNGFKIQLPEFPCNRFLNHSPDICLDTKTSTRSVLDVLQDLSRKRIHTKDDTEATKRKCKGLGGDSPLDIEAPYKPLFISKTKTGAVTFRDNTTQTQDLLPVELSLSKKDETIINNKTHDPKAELRRKLARQNNEIFASLSSSTLMYPLKRTSGKLSHDREETKPTDQNGKRVKYFSEVKNDKKLQNGDVSSKDLLSTNNGYVNTSKIDKRHKALDSKLSPNKDRLTTIFLEMQNSNTIMEVLTNNQDVRSTDSTKPTKPLTTDKPNEQLRSPENKNASTGLQPADKDKNTLLTINAIPDDKENDKITNFLNVTSANHALSVCNSDNSSSAKLTSSFGFSTSATINFGASSTSPTFKLPLASTVSSSLTQTPIFSTGVSQKGSMFNGNSNLGGSSESNNAQETIKINAISSEASSPEQKLTFQLRISGHGTDLTQGIGEQSAASFFRFGVVSSQSTSETSPKGSKGETSNSSMNNSTGIASTPALSGFSPNAALVTQSPFTINTTMTTSTLSLSQPNALVFSFTDKSSTCNIENVEKASFQFGFNPTSSSNSTEKSLFGVPAARPEDKSPMEKKAECQDGENPVTSGANISKFQPSEYRDSTFSTSAPSFGQPVVTTVDNVTHFKFGEKAEPAKSETSTGTNFFDKKTSSLFAFGHKAVVSVSAAANETCTLEPCMYQQSNFPFPKTDISASTASQTSNLFGQTTSSQTNIFQQAVVSQASTTANPTTNSAPHFGSTSQTSDPLNKCQGSSFSSTSTAAATTTIATTTTTTTTTSTSTTITTLTGIMNNTFTQNKLSAPAFGQPSTASFSGVKSIFGTSSLTTPAFVNAQPGPSFGDSNNHQHATGQTSNFFSQPPACQSSGFPSGFATTTFGQTTSSDGNIFGPNQNQTTPFGSTSQPFGSQTGFSFGGTTSKTAGTFSFSMSAPTATTSAYGFGNDTKTTTASTSTFGFAASAQPEPSQSLFSFNSQTQSSTFKFGNTTKGAHAFGNSGSGSSTFSFSSTPSTSDAAKVSPSIFNFGTPQATSANAGFNFGASQTPVFSFGSSSASSSGSSKFSFGASTASAGIFTPGGTPTPSSVPLQGVFSIGSGSSQPRNRSSAARARRRP